MKFRNLALIFMSLAMFTNCLAQKDSKKDKKDKKGEVEAVVPQAPVEEVVVTEECLVNISLFNESAKNKQYADALGPWNAAYTACPGANRAIYSRGREILHWEISQAKDDAAYQATFDKLMGMYDNRIKYFGDDDRYPTPWIKGLKALDYIIFVKNDPLKKTAYAWLEESIAGMGDNSEMEVVRQYNLISSELFKADATHAEKYIADYLKTNAILESIASNPDNRNAEAASTMKQGLDALFVQSGAADCNTLDKIYGEKVKLNTTNIEYLNNVITFYRRIRCTESEVYFSAAVAAHKIEPTAESANALAEMSYKKKEFSTAITFYEEATRLATEKLDKADYQYKIAQIYYSELNNYPRAREYARNSLEHNPNSGSPYLLIGIMYARSKVYDDPILAKTVFWAAVDKFVRAKQVDSSVAEDADRLIRTYSAYYPSKDDIFMHPDLGAGKSFTVGGWIGESTIAR